MGDRHGGAIADRDGHGIENRLRVGEFTGIGGHLRGGAGVEEPFGCLGAGRRGVRRVQRDKERLVVPWINRWRRWRRLSNSVLGTPPAKYA